jgi:small subunit ribosomal protein S20
MPIIKSAKKRVRVAKNAAIRNSKTKRAVKSAVKAFRAAVTGGGKKAAEAQRAAQSELDKAVKKGVIHKNKAARKKRQLVEAAKANAATKPAKTTAKKASVKKATAEKTTKKS